jgi:hypothetical protein
MGLTQDTKPDGPYITDGPLIARYALLTAALFIPLLLAFGSFKNIYPFAASTMMLADRDMEGNRQYYILRGETVSGDQIDLPPIELTNALSGRNWSLVSAAVENKSFEIRWPHPANALMTQEYGGTHKLPRAARLDDLLRTWGAIYNLRLPASSNKRLKSIQLDAYRWEGGINGEYHRFIESWKATL